MALKTKIGDITESSIYVNFENINFRFHDVPGDGNCFYHSVLKCSNILRTYKSVEYLRSFSNSTVLCTIDKDVPKYFYYKGKKFQIDFTILDTVHKHVLDYKKENNHTNKNTVGNYYYCT